MTTTSTRSDSASAAALVTPLPGADLQDTFGAPRSGGRTHQGIDIFAERGTPIHAISGGTVVNNFGNELGGKVVYIQGDDGRLYYYAHLDAIEDELDLGDRVDTGAVIGTVGNTGNAATTPSHLHLQVKEGDTWVNPYDFLQEHVSAAPVVDPYEVDDGVPPMAADGDADGLTDKFEVLLETDPNDPDSDDDGLTDLQETTVHHTDPNSPDTDEDGDPDALEVAAGTDAGVAPLPEAAVKAGFGGLATRDSDDDGLVDDYEIDHGLNPHASDSDGDRLLDGLEIAAGSSAVSNDSDEDGVDDGAEYDQGTLEALDPPAGPEAPFEQQAFGDTHGHDHGDDAVDGDSGPTEAEGLDVD